MKAIDVGTYTLVACERDSNKEIVYRQEINAFIEIPLENRFVFNMMKAAGVPLVERKDAGIAYALGSASVDMAYTMNQIELKRPMIDGCLNPKEKNSQQIMSVMLHGLIGELKHDKEKLFYCVPANAVNSQTDAEYHSRVLKAMFNAYKDKNGFGVDAHPINEALALLYSACPKEDNYTGLAISFGAGMKNICFSIFGNPVFQFALVDSGDWIDRMSAKATGESIAFINKAKVGLDLTKEQDSLVLRAIKTQYEILMQKTVLEIKKELEKAGNAARAPHPISIVIAGGVTMPLGFSELFEKLVREAKLPIEIKGVIRPPEPLLSVAKGCLLAAEQSE